MRSCDWPLVCAEESDPGGSRCPAHRRPSPTYADGHSDLPMRFYPRPDDVEIGDQLAMDCSACAALWAASRNLCESHLDQFRAWDQRGYPLDRFARLGGRPRTWAPVPAQWKLHGFDTLRHIVPGSGLPSGSVPPAEVVDRWNLEEIERWDGHVGLWITEEQVSWLNYMRLTYADLMRWRSSHGYLGLEEVAEVNWAVNVQRSLPESEVGDLVTSHQGWIRGLIWDRLIKQSIQLVGAAYDCGGPELGEWISLADGPAGPAATGSFCNAENALVDAMEYRSAGITPEQLRSWMAQLEPIGYRLLEPWGELMDRDPKRRIARKVEFLQRVVRLPITPAGFRSILAHVDARDRPHSVPRSSRDLSLMTFPLSVLAEVERYLDRGMTEDTLIAWMGVDPL